MVIAQCVRYVGRCRKGSYKNNVQIVWQLFNKVLIPRVISQKHLVPLIFAPDGHDLRHNGRQIGSHHPRVPGGAGGIGYDIDDTYSKLSHEEG